jgi:hypothetical protein
MRGGPGSSQSELPCITRPLWLRTVTYRPVGPTGLYMYCTSLLVGLSTDPVIWRVRLCQSVFFWSILYFIILNMINFKSKFERLGYHVLQCLVWATIFETGIYFVIFYYYIYPAYLGSWYCPKSFLFWPLVGTEKFGMRSAGLSGYSVGSHLFISRFDTFYGMRSSDPWLVQCRLPFVFDLLIHG